MVVNVSSAGQFHTLDLARQMNRLGQLGHLFTGCPKCKVHGLPSTRVHTFPWLTVPTWAVGKLGCQKLQKSLFWSVHETFDSWLASNVTPCDVFHSLSSYGLHSHRAAKARYGALTVCDRGSSHIVYQDELLAAEYARHSMPYQRIDQRMIQKELQEYAECDLITVPSTFAYRSFLQKGVPADKVAVLPYGVDLAMFRPVPKNDDVFRVIYVGAMSIQKGLPDLLEALAPLQLSNFELYLVGPITEGARPFFARYEGGFRYAGAVPRDQLFNHYSQGSVFVMASVQEGLALVQAQAMACGLPVVATTNTGAEDLFKDGVEGFVVPIRSPEAIREKVLFLYRNPDLRHEMAKAAHNRVQSMGGWDSYGDAAVRIYSTALARLHGERPGAGDYPTRASAANL